jgi:hypothetical protein
MIRLLAFVLGCSDPIASEPAPTLDGFHAPSPVLEGSELRVTGFRFERLGSAPELVIDSIRLPLLREGESAGELWFEADAELVSALGIGSHSIPIALEGLVESEPYSVSFEIANDLDVTLETAPSGDVARNEVAVLRGAGFVSEREGTVTARFEGTFTPESGAPQEVTASLPVALAEPFARDRGLVRLTTAIGGLSPGEFGGTLTLESELAGGARSTSAPRDVSLRFGTPELFALEPNAASLEQVLTVRGSGFLGGPDEPDEATVIRLSGMFTPAGGSAMPFGPSELVLRWVSGEEMRATLEADVMDRELVSTVFGARRGVFMGSAVPVAIKGIDELTGVAVPFGLELAPVQQVVYLRFVAPFYDSLTRFGLASAAGIVEALVEARIESIYDDWLVDVRLERPSDFSDNGFATLEIGGPDPNGAGLFGYDNTPGKDIGNLRLFDQIGGVNAEVQEDGSPGYGGVFVESMLFFSSHPDLPGGEPSGRPDADPLFDEIFDPVRDRAATRAELMGEGDPARVAEVMRALAALSAMIGETAAHELGHSFGLADPFGSPTTYHNATDGDGCLMDSGSSRPLGERTAQDGFAPTRLCHDEPAYLDAILGP